MPSTWLFTFHQGEAVSLRLPVDGLPVTAGWSVTFTLFTPAGPVVRSCCR
jgi:hypothetical protein